VSFDGRSITYGIGELDALVPAYGASIHKSQGSECPAVVIPVMTQHYAMLQRNLLYTAVTRGKRLVLLVGLPDIMHSRHASIRPRSAIPCSFDQRRRPETLRTAIATLLHRATMVVAALFGETFRLECQAVSKTHSAPAPCICGRATRIRSTASTAPMKPWTIGTNVSSGCIRLINADVTDLYNRTPVGTKVIVLTAVAPTAMR
jgi:UvrD-like helicase C-terminal domain/L,D-transpeptidase catalytic domain